MFSLKLLLICFLLTGPCWALELNKEVTVQKTPDSSVKELELELKIKGLDEILNNQLTILGVNLEKFKIQVEKKHYSKENYLNFLESFFNKAELIIIAQNEKVSSSDTISAIVNVDLDQEKAKKMALEIIEDLDFYKKNNFYFDYNLDLQANTTWEDLGVNSEAIFNDALINSWRELLIPQYAARYSNVVFVQENDKNILENFSNIIPSESVILKLNIKIKKTFENKSISMAGYEIFGDYVLIKARDRSSILSYDFPVQKKELSTKNKKELSSNIASLVYNFLKFQTKKIEEKIANNVLKADNRFKLTGQKMLSELSQVQSVLEKYLLPVKGHVVIKKFSTSESELAILDTNFENLIIMLNKMGKLPLSDDKNEQKVLIFNAETKSFAINQKD